MRSVDRCQDRRDDQDQAGLRGSCAGRRVHIRERKEGLTMLSWALTFLVIAIIAGVVGLSGVAGTATNIAYVLFVLFLIFSIVGMFVGRRPPA